MKHDIENLQDLYVENYLQPITDSSDNQTQVIEESNAGDSNSETIEEKKKMSFKKKFKKGKKKGDDEVGAITYDSVNFDSQFDKILREFADDGGDGGEFGEENDFDYDYGDDSEGLESQDAETLLRSIYDQLKAHFEGEEEGGGEEDFMGGGEDDEAVPTESYAFEGGGAEHGAKGNYDGKAKPQSKSNLVKDNGDIDKSKQRTGHEPEDTEGSEGAEHGAQGEYDGKAKSQPKSNHVKDNGDAKTGSSQNTGYKTHNGKGNNQF